MFNIDWSDKEFRADAARSAAAITMVCLWILGLFFVMDRIAEAKMYEQPKCHHEKVVVQWGRQFYRVTVHSEECPRIRDR